MKSHLIGTMLAASCVVFSPFASAADIDSALLTPAPRVDNGVGELPRYTGSPDVWVYAQPAAKTDNGLGAVQVSSDSKEVWLHMQPAPKMDSGLGEITAPARLARREATGG
jgi:hypothetical protein